MLCRRPQFAISFVWENKAEVDLLLASLPGVVNLYHAMHTAHPRIDPSFIEWTRTFCDRVYRPRSHSSGSGEGLNAISLRTPSSHWIRSRQSFSSRPKQGLE
ncbi:hypothetical protein CPB84DRAFT_1466981 [Gymnopilus junonius]|uniref:Uncharacterized protein n=1 Tax=Gymnopilus junonius TaxID=109634 RepID=A0A9P5NIL8_GYMJU|nr:hypothetical protein CPB84DRAFT_1466981 [Gymnopilus junonius]